MNDERPTFEMTTQHGFVAVLKEWITEDESRGVMKAYSAARAQLRNIDAKKQTADVEATEALLDANINAQNASIALVVVSVGGSSEGVVDAVTKGMPKADAHEIIAAVEKIMNPEKNEEGTLHDTPPAESSQAAS